MPILCPLCASPTQCATKEEHIREVAYRATIHAWGCPTCYWVDLIPIEDPKEDGPPTPRKDGYGGIFREELAAFIERCDVDAIPTDAIKELPNWSARLKTVLREERRVRRMVGLAKHKPVSGLELQFQNLLKRSESEDSG